MPFVAGLVACLLAGLWGCGEARERSSSTAPRVIVGEIPCAPRRVLENVCQQCHTTPRKYGAPFPLITYGDVQAALDGRPVAYWMEASVREGAMPLPPVELASDDRETLLAWLAAGAPARGPGDVCEPPADTGPSD